MQGRRIQPIPHSWAEGECPYQPGDYWRWGDAGWYAATPNGELANLTGHTVTEHADGTITVSPSIEIKAPPPAYWHGFLERGVWRSC